MNILINFNMFYTIAILNNLDVCWENNLNQAHLDNAKVFKALCEETRLAILEFLRSGEKCACMLLKNVAVRQSTLSHHMKILIESGFVIARKEGKWTYYSLNPIGSEKTIRLLKEIVIPAKDSKNDNTGCYE